MNAIVKTDAVPALQMNEAELINVLQSSLYPGAKLESIKMVVSYCKAAHLDPMQKPVHIVPMWDSKAGAMRDVIMPGVGLYRTQAARSGCAGVTEPEFGPDISKNIGGKEIIYPQWCRVTVKRRLSTGEIAEFTAKEIWTENYAIQGGKDKSIAPNAMWTKRPYGQLAKCAEAQALRKAFPEIGSEPTADEMEGKALHDYQDAIEGTSKRVERDLTDTDEFKAFEANALKTLQDSAIDGMAALQETFGQMPKSDEKTALWKKHSEKLKSAAEEADKAAVAGGVNDHS